MGEYTVVGKRLPLKDAPEKVTGSAVYTADMVLPGMLYAKVLRSPHAHARVINVDTSKAEKLPGVKAVLTKHNSPKNRVPVSFNLPSDIVAFDDKVRFVGDGVAAVAAASLDIAEEALKLLKVEYELLPAVFDPQEALKQAAPLVHDDKPGNVAINRKIEFGDIKAGFQQADIILEDEYRTSKQMHCCMEQHCAIASFNAAGDLTVWASTQLPSQLHFQLAEYLALPMSKIRVIKPAFGGGFGSKLDMLVEHTCALLSRISGHPVKLVLSRQEEFAATVSRHAFVIRLKMGVKKDGAITAIEASGIGDVGAHMYKGAIVVSTAGSSLTRVYRCPNVRYEGLGVYTNTIPAGAFRGFGNPQGYFALESMVDTVCEKLGIDPAEFRLKNYKSVGETGRTGMPIMSSGFDECVRQGAQLISWQRRENPSKKDGLKRRGIGMSSVVHGSGARPLQPDISSAFVKINEDGTAHVFTGAADIGTGSNTTLAQIAAEELGLTLDDISLTGGDTGAAPFDEGAYASRTLYVAGGAVKAAAADARRQLISYIAAKFGVPVETLEVRDKRVYMKDNQNKGLTIAEIARECRRAKEGAMIFLGKSSYEDPTSAQTFAAHFAEVEVDTETGQVEVLRLVAAHDVGKAINPMVIEGQIEGAIQEATGYALTEQPIYDKNTGKMLNADFSNYMMLTALDMPEVQTCLVESVDPTGPFGAKGMSEPPFEAVAPAIANAIYNAIGVRLKQIPITPELIIKELKRKTSF